MVALRGLVSRQSWNSLLASHSTRIQAGSTAMKWFSSDNSLSIKETYSLEDRLLMGALKHVPAHGWTEDAITAAAAELKPKLSLATAGLFTKDELVSKAMRFWNRALREELEERWGVTESNENVDDNDRIIQAFQWRLERVQHLIQCSRWHEGMAVGAQPGQIAHTKNQIAEIIDITVSHCSFNLSAAQRMSLGAVYVAVEFHMLCDNSERFSDTWIFLRKLVHDWSRLRMHSTAISLPYASSGAFWTATEVGSAIFSGVYTILSRPSVTVGTTPQHYDSTRTS